VPALVEKVKVHFTQAGSKGIGIKATLLGSTMKAEAKGMPLARALCELDFKEPFGAPRSHAFFGPAIALEKGGFGSRMKTAHDPSGTGWMDSQKRVGVVVPERKQARGFSLG
jgi:hypothetical protein